MMTAETRLLPHRARWHLTHWTNLSRRERRRLRKRPILRTQQRAWETAWPERLNLTFKRMYSGSISSMFPPETPFMRFIADDGGPIVSTPGRSGFMFPTSK